MESLLRTMASEQDKTITPLAIQRIRKWSQLRYYEPGLTELANLFTVFLMELATQTTHIDALDIDTSDVFQIDSFEPTDDLIN